LRGTTAQEENKEETKEEVKAPEGLGSGTELWEVKENLNRGRGTESQERLQ